MNIFDFEDQEFGIKGVNREEIKLLKKLCDEYGQIPYHGAEKINYYYPYEFSEKEWVNHTKNCDKIVGEILERIKYLPEKIECFDWWEMESTN
jgi:hypothetical protein